MPQEFNIEKLHLLEAEKARVRKDYERREGQIDVKKKIEYSKQLNASRIKVLQTREDVVHGILDEVGAAAQRTLQVQQHGHCCRSQRSVMTHAIQQWTDSHKPSLNSCQRSGGRGWLSRPSGTSDICRTMNDFTTAGPKAAGGFSEGQEEVRGIADRPAGPGAREAQAASRHCQGPRGKSQVARWT